MSCWPAAGASAAAAVPNQHLGVSCAVVLPLRHFGVSNAVMSPLWLASFVVSVYRIYRSILRIMMSNDTAHIKYHFHLHFHFHFHFHIQVYASFGEALSNIRFLWRGFINYTLPLERLFSYTLPLERLFQVHASFGEAFQLYAFFEEAFPSIRFLWRGFIK